MRLWILDRLREPFAHTLPFYDLAMFAIREMRGVEQVPGYETTRWIRFVDDMTLWWRFSVYVYWTHRLSVWIDPK